MLAVVLTFAALLHSSTAINSQQQLEEGATYKAHYQALENQWGKELSTMKPGDNPIRKVQELLEGMQKELEEEKANDLKLYDDLKCWCETSFAEIQRKLSYDKSCIRDWTDKIEMYSHNIGVAQAQIPRMEIDLFKLKKALLESDVIRKEEAEKFHLLQQDLSQTIINAKNAITILSKHHDAGASFMQPGSPLLSSMQSVLREMALKYELLEVNKPYNSSTEAGAGSGNAVLLSIKSVRKRMTAEANSALHAQDRVLMDALDVSGQTLLGVLPVKFAQQELANAAANIPKAGFLQMGNKQPGVYQSYASQSGVIFGILKQMLDDFEKELADAQKVEAKAIADYNNMQRVGYAEIGSLTQRIYETKVLLATSLKRLSDAKMYLKGCYNEEQEDKGFQDHLKDVCGELEMKWQERSKARQKEIIAVAETLKILTEDTNRETLYKSMKHFEGKKEILVKEPLDFMQISSTQTERRSKAETALRRSRNRARRDDDDDLLGQWQNMRKDGAPKQVGAISTHSPRKSFSGLMTRVKKSSFTKIKIAMDRMIANLKKQQADEVAFKQTCVEDMNENDKMIYKKEEEKDDLGGELYDLGKEIYEAKNVIKKNEIAIPKLEMETKKASQNREEENHEFQMMMSGQYAVQGILTKALKRLQRYYTEAKGGDGETFLQISTVTEMPPEPITTVVMPTIAPIPVGPVERPRLLGEYKKSKQGSPVIGFIEQIIEDSKKLTSDGVTNENASQEQYEQTIKELTEEITTCQETVKKTKALLAEKNWEKANKQAQFDSASQELEALEQYKADLKDKCNFVLKNYEVRQHGRLQEIEGIIAAKANLDGGKITLNKDCSRVLCKKAMCWDGKPTRQIGDDCCACPPDEVSIMPVDEGGETSGLKPAQPNGERSGLKPEQPNGERSGLKPEQLTEVTEAA